MVNEIELAKIAGLAPMGKDTEGRQEYVGTKEQWKKFEELMFEEETEEEYNLIDEKIKQDSVECNLEGTGDGD